MKCLMCLMASIGLMLLMSSSLSVEAKKPKKYIGENGGDFEFIDEDILLKVDIARPESFYNEPVHNEPLDDLGRPLH
uniref:Secreted protein n=1 Tax=Glossina morsitans morsitans TaxID=37546 RepID=A0A1B0FCT4_GLOMM